VRPVSKDNIVGTRAFDNGDRFPVAFIGFVFAFVFAVVSVIVLVGFDQSPRSNPLVVVIQLDRIGPRQRQQFDRNSIAFHLVAHFRFVPAVEHDSVRFHGGRRTGIPVAHRERRRLKQKKFRDRPQYGRMGPANVEAHDPGGHRPVGRDID